MKRAVGWVQQRGAWSGWGQWRRQKRLNLKEKEVKSRLWPVDSRVSIMDTILLFLVVALKQYKIYSRLLILNSRSCIDQDLKSYI